MKELNRNMPLRYIMAVQAIRDIDWSPYTPSKSEDYVLIEDPIPGSKFYFRITNVDAEGNGGKNRYTLEYHPFSEEGIGPEEVNIDPNNLILYYNRWKGLVEKYNLYWNKNTQNSILEGYEDEYYAEFDIADDDADVHSYGQQAQNNIDDFLAMVAERLQRYKAETTLTDEVIEEIDVLIADIDRLRKTQARQTKRTVFRQFINIMARFRKAAPTVAREIGKDIVKDLLIEGIKDPSKFLDFLNGLLG